MPDPAKFSYVELLERLQPEDLSLIKVQEGFTRDTAAMLAAYPLGIAIDGVRALYREHGLASADNAHILLSRMVTECLRNGEGTVGADAACPARALMVEIAKAHPQAALAVNANSVQLPPEVLRTAFRRQTEIRRAAHPQKPQVPTPSAAVAAPETEAAEAWPTTVSGELPPDVPPPQGVESIPPDVVPVAAPVAATAIDASKAPLAEEVVVPFTAPTAPVAAAVTEAVVRAQAPAAESAGPTQSSNVMAVLDMLEAVRSGHGQHMNIPDTRVLPSRRREREGTINPTTENGHARAS